MKQIKISEEKCKKKWVALFGIIIIISCIRFFYGIFGDYYTFLDEYQTFDVAAGLTYAGEFYRWDFHNEELTDIRYIRAWPHTVLLMLWFKIFGVNVVAGKALSGVFGIIFIASVFCITKKIYNNYYISILSCLIILANTTVLTIFRQIRMYSLWLLLMVWLLYYVFKCFCDDGQFKGRNKITFFLQQYCNFSFSSIVVALGLLIISYNVHMNTIISSVGIMLFFLYLLITKREKKYYSMGTVIVILIGLFILALYINHHFFVIPGVYEIWWMIFKEGNFALREEINERYWHWFLDFLGNRTFVKLAVCCILFAIIKNWKNRKDKAYDFSIYSFFTVSSALVCFLFFLTRYYQDRYMAYVIPFLAIIMAWGIVETFSAIKVKWSIPFGMIVCTIFLVINVVKEFDNVYANSEICYHRDVYELVREDAKEEMPDKTLALAGYNFRDYYGVQVFEDYVTAAFDRENDMEILKEFAKENPDGYVLVESAKINGFPEVIKLFIQNHSERVAGDGIDRKNIEVVRYHFLSPNAKSTETNLNTQVENGPIVYSFIEAGGKTKVRIDVDTAKLESDVDTLFLTFGIFTLDKETEDKCYQLQIPEDASGEIYSYEGVINKACQVVLLKDDCMLYYNDGTCREKLIYEK